MQRYQLRAVSRLALRMSLLAGILVAGCASPPQVSIEEQLSLKTLQWTDALMVQDYERALTFMTPSYQNSPRAKRFQGEFGGATYWQGAEIKWVKCDEESRPFGSSDVEVALEVEVEAASITKSNVSALDSADDCVVNAWETCGFALVEPVSTMSTVSSSSDRCELRMILTVMKPPEMSFPTSIPYEVTWLNVDGSWYIYFP